MIWHGCKSEQCKCSYNASEIHFAFRGLRKAEGACQSATSKCSETKKGVLCLSCLRLFDLEPIAPVARQGSEASSALNACLAQAPSGWRTSHSFPYDRSEEHT